ncbi:MAG TPA: triose-phosphate isomerase [Stellaceae bacterium]|nr:triose-phosphate isomerase [Stellaceae bacterium]
MVKLAAGNWKMNGLRQDGLALARELARRAAAKVPGCALLVCPPATLVMAVADALAGSAIAVGGQDCHEAAKGAHTGDLSAVMLKDAGCRFVILGHSERRLGHGESDARVRAKVETARAAGLAVILCIGETFAERDSGATLTVLSRQIAGSLPNGLAAAEVAIAYEPVWAIGTGRTPTLEQVAEAHAHIRAALAAKLDDAAAIRILYGGSVKADNASALMAVANVDGALVGGASLDAGEFWAIAHACGA